MKILSLSYKKEFMKETRNRIRKNCRNIGKEQEGTGQKLSSEWDGIYVRNWNGIRSNG